MDEEETASADEAAGKRKKDADDNHVEPTTKRTKGENGDAVTTTTTMKLYVRGLPWRVVEDEVRDFFSGCGEIVNCELLLQADGRSSGTAVIEFGTAEAIAAALELDGQDFQGRWLKITEFFKCICSRNDFAFCQRLGLSMLLLLFLSLVPCRL